MTQCNCSNCTKLRKVQYNCLKALVDPSAAEHVRIVWNSSLEELKCLNPLAEKYNSNGTRVWVHNQTVGPRHDPYGRTTITVERNGHQYEIVTCALAGDSYSLDGHVVIQGYYDKSSGPVSPYNAFRLAAGAGPDEYEKWYYDHIYCQDPYEAMYGRNE
jgi:hypothetical protein